MKNTKYLILDSLIDEVIGMTYSIDEAKRIKKSYFNLCCDRDDDKDIVIIAQNL